MKENAAASEASKSVEGASQSKMEVELDLPSTSMQHIEGFLKTIHKHKDNPGEMEALVRALSGDVSAFQQLQVGLQKLSLQSSSPGDGAATAEPPIVSQSKHNNQQVVWSECDDYCAVDERAFKVHKPSGLLMDCKPRHDPRMEDTKVALAKESMAKNYEKRKMISIYKETGNREQRRLVLLSFLSDPDIRDEASSIGVNLKEARIGRHILHCWRRIMSRAQSTANKNGRIIDDKRALVQSMATAAVPTPTKEGSSRLPQGVSKKDVIRHLNFSSYSSGHRHLTKGEEKREQIAEGEREGWTMLDEKESWSKLPEELLDSLEAWIQNNEKVKESPEKSDQLRMRDRDGKFVESAIHLSLVIHY